MSTASKPLFYQTPWAPAIELTGNTPVRAPSGVSNLTQIGGAVGTGGLWVKGIRFKPQANVSAGLLLFFQRPLGSGDAILIAEQAVTAYTAVATVASPTFWLPVYKLFVATDTLWVNGPNGDVYSVTGDGSE